MRAESSPLEPRASRTPTTLAERFWSLARGMNGSDSSEPVAVVRHVLAVLDALGAGQIGPEITANTTSFLALLRESELRGDLLYASPEQARGEYVDERSLVFSVGVLIFEKLTGRHPFGADGNPNRMARIRRAEMASGVNYFQTISGPLRTILLRCMGPFPEERWANLGELRIQLEAFVAGDVASDRVRPLPALPIDEQPTQILERRPRRASDQALRAAVQRESSKRQPTSNRLPTLQLESPSWTSRLIWMTAGALAAALVVLLARSIGDGDETANRSPLAAAARAPLVTPMPTAEPEPSAPAQPAVTEEVANRAPTAPETADEPPATGTFNPDVGGENALTAARTCFAPERLEKGISFGASLLFDAHSGKSRRVYFGQDRLVRGERSCLKSALVGISAGAAPQRTTPIVYRFWLDQAGGGFKVPSAQ